MSPYKGVLIDPFACKVSAIEYDGDWRSIYPLLSHESMPVTTFQVIRPRGLMAEDVLYLDEEGRLKPCDRFFHIDGFPEPIAGKGIIFGTTGSTTTSAITSAGMIRGRVHFFERYGNGLAFCETPWTPPAAKE